MKIGLIQIVTGATQQSTLQVPGGRITLIEINGVSYSQSVLNGAQFEAVVRLQSTGGALGVNPGNGFAFQDVLAACIGTLMGSGSVAGPNIVQFGQSFICNQRVASGQTLYLNTYESDAAAVVRVVYLITIEPD